MRKREKMTSLFLAGMVPVSVLLTGCGGGQENSGKIEIELVQYKQEAEILTIPISLMPGSWRM